jgi:hypothetical protein
MMCIYCVYYIHYIKNDFPGPQVVSGSVLIEKAPLLPQDCVATLVPAKEILLYASCARFR